MREYRPQIAGAVLAAINLAAFWRLAYAFATSPALMTFDARVAAAIQSTRSPGLTAVMVVVTFLGDTLAVSVMTGITAVLLLRRGLRSDALYVVGTVAVGATLSTFTKGLLGRARPAIENALIALPGSFSFPSGHTMGSLCFAWAFGYLVLHTGWDRRRKIAMLALALAYPIAVGTSRVYLGVHWPSDVLASWFLGGAWLSLITGAYFGWKTTRLRDSSVPASL